jgi:hypothetical protein
MNRSKTINITKTFALAAIGALALSVAPAGRAADKGCSNTTLQGTFAFNGTGSIIMPAVVAGPLANVNTIVFDGNGGVTSPSGIQSQNGNISSVTETGTYKVNSDCTGTYTVVISPGGFTAHYFFVIDANVSGLEIICTDSGVVFSGIARRQFPVNDWRN